MREKRPTPKSDVFSFGRIVFFAATSVVPNATVSRIRIQRQLREGAAFPLSWPQTCFSILEPSHKPVVEACCCDEPARRPEMRRVQTLLRQAAFEALGEAVS